MNYIEIYLAKYNAIALWFGIWVTISFLFYRVSIIKIVSVLLLLLLLLLFTAIEFSLGVSSPYTSTGKTNKNKYTQTKQYKNSTNNIKHSKYKYTYYQTPAQLSKHLPSTKPTTYFRCRTAG